MKSKRIKELDAVLRDRARERTRQQQTKKAATRQKPAKQKQAEKTPKPPAVGKRPTPKDYEPQDRPISKLNARRAFLSKINEVAPEKVKALFDSCFKSFLKLTRYSLGTYSDGAPMTQAEIFPPDMLESDAEYLRLILDLNPGFEGLPELQNCLTNKRKFCERLSLWGRDCGIDEKWFLEFGWQALLRFWELTKPPGSPTALPMPETEPPRRSLREVALRAINPHSTGQEGASAQRVPPLAPFAKTSSSPKVVEEANELIFERQRSAWLSAIQVLEFERDFQMTAPEHKPENKYDLVGGFFPSQRREKPKALWLQPPQPPEGLPPIADAYLGRVITRKLYETLIRRELSKQFLNGPACGVPEKVRKKWVDEAFAHRKTDIDDFWRKYGDYLKAQDWVAVEPKKALSLHCEWFVRFVVLGAKLGQIAEAVDRAGGINEQAISDAIRKIAALAEVKLKERRGRKTQIE